MSGKSSSRNRMPADYLVIIAGAAYIYCKRSEGNETSTLATSSHGTYLVIRMMFTVKRRIFVFLKRSPFPFPATCTMLWFESVLINDFVPVSRFQPPLFGDCCIRCSWCDVVVLFATKMMPRTIEEGFADQALLTYTRYCEAVEKSQRWKDIENLIDFSVCLNLSTEGLQGNFGYSTYIPYSTVPVKSWPLMSALSGSDRQTHAETAWYWLGYAIRTEP
ncbi:uncharacterized protein RAG0_08057 [Rhynchosporium agropyri]|uniref:Uncharacterized protein n=1 Tax=Rhynchosporium agropyri TaxID=914238 RepID=A0A1E1KS22_9HELO|nr:uncharacterized protein RAG0_08057 [Rhynchosporium agropyri]